MLTARFRRTLAAGSIVLAAGCGREDRGGVGRAAETAPPLRHAVHSERLHEVMQRMGQRVRRTWPQEIEGLKAEQARRDQQTRFRDASRFAGALAEAAGMIPESITGADLSDEDRQAFLDDVNKLREQSEALEAQASARDRQGMEATLDQIKRTCTSCHAQFRELAGPLRFGY